MNFSRFDHQCMARALRLARKGLYSTHPNPRVGCVIAQAEGVIGQGWHELAGAPHAEIMALRDAGTAAKASTVYVTLEPCSHHGRTPPCAAALLQAGVSRVVIASADPNPQVNGQGLDRLKADGVKVEMGLMAAEAEQLNAGFYTRMRKGRPWVRVKAAISLDGRTGLRNGDSKWISSEASRRDVQSWRARSSAILTGIGTVLADNPSMTARLDGLKRQPLRVIAVSRWRTTVDSRIRSDQKTAVIAGNSAFRIPRELEETEVGCLPLSADDGKTGLRPLMTELAKMEVNEVQVEAGSILCGALMRNRLVDEVLIYQAPVLLGEGGPGPFRLGPLESMDDRTHLRLLETAHIGKDLRLRFSPEYRS
jgi:diaminohydroxyphosphoribosylaminopyrimidine deaminase/5-amino-6-(5-phosphoribosylamino)uracil reductase